MLDQVIYKWDHSRQIIGNVLADKYSDLLDTGWKLTRAEIERDVRNLFSGTFEKFTGGRQDNRASAGAGTGWRDRALHP